ncbi:MAG TPA: hypothetical protein VIX37_14845 [Candidatus Sulfotelmatobacter sp.]
MALTLNPVLGQIRGGSPTLFVLGGGAPTGGSGGITIGAPGPGTSTGTTTTTTTNTSLLNPSSWLQSFFSSIGCSVGDALLRIAFFILGFICVVGAIYLYKGNNTILQIPARLTRTAIRTGRTAMETEA